MAKKVSWKWGGKTYSGTLIRETKTHKFARTHNGKIKKIVKEDGEYISVAKSVRIYEKMNPNAGIEEVNEYGDKFSTKKQVDNFISNHSFTFSKSTTTINKIPIKEPLGRS